jgi:hypothetical protein
MDALKLDPPGRSSDQQQPSNGTADPSVDFLMNVQNGAGNTHTTEAATITNTASPSQVVYSPDSDWVDIDGIIQSFLQENGGRAARSTETNVEVLPNHIPRTPLSIPRQGSTFVPVAMDNALFVGNQASPGRHVYASNGVHQSEAAPGTYQWQNEWRLMNGESAPLDDPLFGFNGSSMDSLTLPEW